MSAGISGMQSCEYGMAQRGVSDHWVIKGRRLGFG